MIHGLAVSPSTVRGPGWVPDNLGSALYDYWDAERASTLTLVGSAVSAWRSVKNGYSAEQATSANRPTFSATGFNNRPGVTFDGANDELTYAGVGAFPTGANACEIWMLVDQPLPGETAGSGTIFTYGGNGATTYRRVIRVVATGTNRAALQSGNGGGAPVIRNDAVEFSGRHVVRATVRPTDQQVDVSGVAGSAAVTGASTTAATRTRIGARNDDAPADFFTGAINFIAITAPLTTDQAAALYAYLNRRK